MFFCLLNFFLLFNIPALCVNYISKMMYFVEICNILTKHISNLSFFVIYIHSWNVFVNKK